MKKLLTILLLSLTWCVASAQTPDNTVVTPAGTAPTMHVTVVARSVSAVDYRHGKISRLDFKGTDLLPRATGEAAVDSKGAKTGRTNLYIKASGLDSPEKFGMEYLTYVVWAITPEGRAVNLGELVRDDDNKADLKATTDLQAFALIVTAEPYFAVTQPSDVVVLENVVTDKTLGSEHPIIARYSLLPRHLYLATNEPVSLVYGKDSKAPLSLLEARNAVRIAKIAGAKTYADGSLERAEGFLNQAEDYYGRKQNKNAIDTVARAACQTAEEARVMSIRRVEQEHVAAERRAAEMKVATAQQQAQDATAAALAEKQAAQQQAENARLQAQQAQEQAQAAQQAALDQQRAAQEEAERARQQAQQAQLQAQQAEQARAAAEQDREATRARLLNQLNQVLQTRDTAEGLIVNMPDVLFDFNKSTLKPAARERLAKVAGIVQAYPDLRLKIEGFTDSIGTEQYNQKLSEERAATVRDYLTSQGVNLNNVTAQGLGESNPVASNSTAEGRQQNRRVEMVVSGEAIGTQIPPSNGNTAGSAGTSVGTTSSSGNTTSMPSSSTTQTPVQSNTGTVAVPADHAAAAVVRFID